MTIALGTLAIVAVVIAAGVLLDRKVGLLPRPERVATPRAPAVRFTGATPATALRADAAALDRLRAHAKCPVCRTAMSAEPDDTVRFDGRELLVLSFRCGKCGGKRAIYVEHAS